MKSFLCFRLRCLIGLAGLLGPVIALAQPYTATIDLTAGVLYNSSGQVLPQGDLVLLVADTGTNGFGPLDTGSSLTVGSFLNSEDQIIGSTTVSTQEGSYPTGTAVASFPSIPVGSGSYTTLAAGDSVAVFWFTGLNSSSTVLTPGSYGYYTTSVPADGSASWVVPPSGAGAVDLVFETGADFGSNPETAGYANLTAVPEPATYALLAGVAALVGAVGIRFRQKKATWGG